MTSDSGRNEWLELYKLHSELADRVSQRRERANRLHVSLFAGLIAGFVAFVRLRSAENLDPLLGLVLGGLGASLSVSWFAAVWSYRQLNAAKFSALRDLEENLPYPFFERESEYRKGCTLTVVETVLPVVFFVLSCGSMWWAISQ